MFTQCWQRKWLVFVWVLLLVGCGNGGHSGDAGTSQGGARSLEGIYSGVFSPSSGDIPVQMDGLVTRNGQAAFTSESDVVMVGTLVVGVGNQVQGTLSVYRVLDSGWHGGSAINQLRITGTFKFGTDAQGQQQITINGQYKGQGSAGTVLLTSSPVPLANDSPILDLKGKWNWWRTGIVGDVQTGSDGRFTGRAYVDDCAVSGQFTPLEPRVDFYAITMTRNCTPGSNTLSGLAYMTRDADWKTAQIYFMASNADDAIYGTFIRSSQ